MTPSLFLARLNEVIITSEVWVSIYIYDGVLSDVHVFGHKEDALRYFDSFDFTSFTDLDENDYDWDEETGNCHAFYSDGGRHPEEITILKTEIESIESLLKKAKKEEDIQ